MLEEMNNLNKIDGIDVVKRDPKMFKFLLKYLRKGPENVHFDYQLDEQMFQHELAYWNI